MVYNYIDMSAEPFTLVFISIPPSFPGSLLCPSYVLATLVFIQAPPSFPGSLPCPSYVLATLVFIQAPPSFPGSLPCPSYVLATFLVHTSTTLFPLLSLFLSQLCALFVLNSADILSTGGRGQGSDQLTYTGSLTVHFSTGAEQVLECGVCAACSCGQTRACPFIL